jgi:hypothetical protein
MLGKNDLCSELLLGTKMFTFEFPLIYNLLNTWYELSTTIENIYILLRRIDISYGLGLQSHLLEIDLSTTVYPLWSLPL